MGKLLAERLVLPIWLDSIGTVFTAYAFGPVCGAIVGVTVNTPKVTEAEAGVRARCKRAFQGTSAIGNSGFSQYLVV